MSKPEPKDRKRVLLLISLIVILQGIILLGLGIFSFLFFQKNVFPTELAAVYVNFQTLSSVFIFMGIISIFVLKDFLEKEEVEIKTSRLQLKQSEEIIRSLRMQRHDFNNQLSIIKAWAELGDSRSILRYLQDERAAVRNTEIFEDIRCPVLHALFLVTQVKAMEDDIKLVVDSLITLEDFDYSWSKTNRIFSNLLNNAIEAVAAQKQKGSPDREIHVYIWDTEEHFIFQIWTPTMILSGEPAERVFVPGVTTKSNPGHGYGLSIVQQLVRELNGRISVTAEPETGAEFRLEFRKKTKGYSPRVKQSRIHTG